MSNNNGVIRIYGGISQVPEWMPVATGRFRNCLKLELMPKIKKSTPALKGDFLIFRAPFRVRGNPKNQKELNLNSFLNSL